MGFLDGGFWGTGALPVGASSLPGHYWRRSSHGPPLSGSFCGLFWLFAGFGPFGCPYPGPSALLGFLAWVWPGFCFFFGLCAFLGLLPFCLGHGPPLAFFALAFWPLRRPCLFALLFWAVRSEVALWWASRLCCYSGGGLSFVLFCLAALLVGGLVGGGARGDIQGCPFVSIRFLLFCRQ